MDLILCCTCAKTKWATLTLQSLLPQIIMVGWGDGMRGGERPQQLYAHTFKVWSHIGISHPRIRCSNEWWPKDPVLFCYKQTKEGPKTMCVSKMEQLSLETRIIFIVSLLFAMDFFVHLCPSSPKKREREFFLFFSFFTHL